MNSRWSRIKRGVRHSLLGLSLLLVGCSITTTPSTNTKSNLTIEVPENPVLYVQNQQLWLAGNAVEDTQQLPTLGGAVSNVAWVNDHQIIYTVAVSGRYQTWLQDFTTGQSRYLTDWRIVPEQLLASPNQAAITVLSDGALYVVALADGQRSRIHEGVVAQAWSPTGQQIVFTTTDGRLLLQDISFDFSLDTPLELLSGSVTAPVFLDEHTVAYEGQWEGHYTIVALDLINQTTTALTSLRFDATDANHTSIQPQLDGEQILYTRTDDTTNESNVWFIHRSKDAPKLILTKVEHPAWTQDPNLIYYKMGDALWRATSSGFNKVKVAESVAIFATPNYIVEL